MVLAGGGTGGHVFPALAVARELRRRGIEVLMVGTARGLETAVFPREGFTLRTIAVTGLWGKGGRALGEAVRLLPQALLQSRAILRQWRPDVVLGLGGYAAGPLCVMAWGRRIPLALHEQNAYPGLTNRILGRLARVAAVTFEASVRFFRCPTVVTGNPIREELLTGDRERARKTLGLMAGRMTVLILGGSQGAHRLNEALIDALPRLGALRGKVQFLHATGTRDLEAVQRAYAAWGGCARAAAFFEEMASVYAATDLAVCRAGATTIAELAALGKPAVLVPYPHAASDHQRWNAAVLVEAGAAEMMRDQDLSGEGLAEAIGAVLGQPERLQVRGAKARSLGRPDAAQSIADLLIALAEGRRG